MFLKTVSTIRLPSDFRSAGTLYRTIMRDVSSSHNFDRLMSAYGEQPRASSRSGELALLDTSLAGMTASHAKTEIEQLRLAPCTVEDMLLSIESGLLTLKRRFIFLHPSWKKERPNHPGKDRSYVSVYDSAKGHLFIMRKTGKTNGAPHDHLLPPIQFVARSA